MSTSRESTAGSRFVLERERLGYASTNAFAAALGVSQSGLSKVEADKSVPGGDVLAKAAALGMDIHWVLTGERRASRVDMELLGMSESAIRDAYADLRGARPLRQITTNALAKVYNATAAKLGPDTDRAEMVREEAASYLEVLNDPQNAEVLDQALFRKASEATSTVSITASGHSRAAGRDMIEGGKRRK